MTNSQTPGSQTRRTWELAIGSWDLVGAALVYAGAALVYTWPLALHINTHLAAPVGVGDPFLNLWIIGWGLQAWTRNPLDVLAGRVFDANIFFPADATLAYSDHMLLQSALLAPLYAVTGNAVLCYNLLFAGSLVASALAMHVFIRAIVGSTGGAYLAGLAWGFWAYRFAHLLHIQLQPLYFMPLAFLFLHRLIAGRRLRDAVGLGVMAGLQAVSSVYYAVIGAVGLGFGAVALAVAVGRWRSGVIAQRLLVAGAIGAAFVAPIAWVYWQVQQDEGFGRNLFEASRGAATLGSYAHVPPQNVLYARTGLLTPLNPERELFPGFVILGLAGAGIVLGRRGDARALVTAMLVVGGLAFLLSLGPEGARDVYAAFQRYVFGFAAIRAPARFAVLVMFALTTLAAIGWRELAVRGQSVTSDEKLRTSRFAAAAPVWLPLLLGLAAVEYLNVPLPLTVAPSRETPVGQWLKREPDRGPVMYLPLALDVESTAPMVQTLEHRRAIVNGYSGQRPNFYSALVDTMKTFPSDQALLALNEIGVRFVVTRSPLEPPADAAAWPFVERARLPDGVIYEVRWTDDMRARLTRDLAVTPAPPGPAPFAPGETARYTVQWTSAAVDLPAGEITIAVQASPPYTFLVRAETAPWIARFFEARDVFITRTDAALLTQLHEREQHEGSRHVTRAYVYKHEEGLVRIGRTPEDAASEDAVSLPLAPASRDALAALFYVRTLRLEPGRRYRIPVNEAGRQVVIELSVGRRERIRVQGKDVEAVRLEPRMSQGTSTRRSATATLWVTDDERRLPVALDLEAGFGRVRAELVSYTP